MKSRTHAMSSKPTQRNEPTVVNIIALITWSCGLIPTMNEYRTFIERSRFFPIIFFRV